jgi:hypothetical protein
VSELTQTILTAHNKPIEPIKPAIAILHRGEQEMDRPSTYDQEMSSFRHLPAVNLPYQGVTRQRGRRQTPTDVLISLHDRADQYPESENASRPINFQISPVPFPRSQDSDKVRIKQHGSHAKDPKIVRFNLLMKTKDHGEGRLFSSAQSDGISC